MKNLSRGKLNERRAVSADRQHRSHIHLRSGFAYTEVMVAGTVLLTAMSLVAVSSFRVSRVWKDVQHERIALTELSNQLDRLTMLPAEEVEDLIDSLDVSSQCKATLENPQLTGSMETEEEFGRRLTLSLTWQSHPEKRSKPAKLTGWLPVASDWKDGEE